MIGNKSSFIDVLKGDGNIPNFMDYHCFIHTQVLCSKVLKFDHVVDVVFKMLNFLRSNSWPRPLSVSHFVLKMRRQTQ